MLRKKRNENKVVTTAQIALWYAFGNIFVKGMVFVSTPIFTRLLSKTEYGIFSNFTSWISVLSVIVTLDFTASIARAKYDYDGNMETYLSSILLTSNFVTLVAYIMVEFNSNFFEKTFAMDIKYIRMMFFYIMFLPAFSYLQTKHRIYRKYKFFVAFAVLSALLRVGAAIVLIWIMEDKLLGRTIGDVLPVTVMNIVLWGIIVYRGKGIDWNCVKYAAIISIPLIPHAISGIVLGSSDRIMITQYVGAEANAMYTLAYQSSLLANLLWTSMNQAWAPWLFDNIQANNRKQIDKNSRIYLGVFAILVVGVLLLTPEVMLALGGMQYYEARFVMPPVILGCVFQFVYGMYVNLEIYAKKTGIISIGTVLAAILNIGLNAIFIPRFGYIAAAYTTLAGYMALFVFHFFIVKVMLKDLKDLYSYKFIFAILSLLFLCGCFVLGLYQNVTLRYMVVSIYLLVLSEVVYKNREKIKAIIGIKKTS